MADKTKSVRVYLPEDVRRWLKVEAAETDTSMTALVERAVRRSMPGQEQDEVSR
jgi:hypothetical protein